MLRCKVLNRALRGWSWSARTDNNIARVSCKFLQICRQVLSFVSSRFYTDSKFFDVKKYYLLLYQSSFSQIIQLSVRIFFLQLINQHLQCCCFSAVRGPSNTYNFIDFSFRHSFVPRYKIIFLSAGYLSRQAADKIKSLRYLPSCLPSVLQESDIRPITRFKALLICPPQPRPAANLTKYYSRLLICCKPLCLCVHRVRVVLVCLQLPCRNLDAACR